MRITALGHAGLRVETGGVSVLCDPWFSPEGAFQASWFPYPENLHLLTPELLSPASILISHEHLDHVDKWLLARVSASVPVIVPRYPSPVLRRKILAGGPRPVIELDPWEVREVAPGVRAFFIPEESPMNHDSAMVIQAGGRCLLNLNDARLSAPQLRAARAEVGGRIDVLAIQGSGASWYPICYEDTPARIAELSLQKRHAKLEYVVRAADIVDPGTVLPFAGPPAFLDPELFQHNDQMGEGGIFPDQQQVADFIGHRGIESQILLPGESLEVGADRKSAADEFAAFSFADRSDYLAAYAERRSAQVEAIRRRYPEPTDDLWEPFLDYFARVLEMSSYFNEKIGMRVGFDVSGAGGGRWSVDFRSGGTGVDRRLVDCQYIYRFESRWLAPILGHVVPWEDFFLSLRFKAWRHPDLYNDHLLGLLKFAWPEALDATEAYERAAEAEESIVVHIDGKDYRIQRYCPHAGQDLQETGELLAGGKIRCLGHHYEFDLQTGECVNGRAPPLLTEEI